ncbi:MAG: hypothetical protein ACI8W3_000092 [Myxococcota bacterium]
MTKLRHVSWPNEQWLKGDLMMQANLATRALILLTTAVLTSCSSAAPRWSETETLPTDTEGGEVYLRELLPTIVPDIPAPSKLRPCCAFGSGIKVRLGPIPIPGVMLDNIISPSDVGVHRYDNGLVTFQQQEDGLRLVQETNGLVYTCRGGFIDTAHVRDYSDWTTYFAAQIARSVDTGAVIELPSEGAVRRIHIEPFPPGLTSLEEIRPAVIALSQYVAFQLSIWHEISTWLGWSSTKAFSEEASAFSPEDLYSNLLGIKIAGKVIAHQRASSEQEYDAHVSEVFIKAINLLGGVEAEAGRRAAQYVDGVWWQSMKRLPSADLVLKRNMDTGETIAPWRISLSHWTAGLENAVEQYCGGDERPVLLTNPSHYRGHALNEFATLEFILEEATEKRLPIPLPEGGVLTHNDFPRLIEAIRKKNDERYGEGASSPVR